MDAVIFSLEKIYRYILGRCRGGEKTTDGGYKSKRQEEAKGPKEKLKSNHRTEKSDGHKEKIEKEEKILGGSAPDITAARSTRTADVQKEEEQRRAGEQTNYGAAPISLEPSQSI